MNRIAVVRCFLVGAFLLPLHLAAQTSTRIPEEPSCSTCRITLTRLHSLGEAQGAGILGEPNSVVRDERGRYFVSHLAGMTWFSVFDENGKFVRRVGRAGQGPGEFTFIRMLRLGPGDSIVAIDNGLGRLTRYSPTLELAGVSPIGGDPFDVEVVSGGQVIVGGELATREGVGQPIHLINAAGQDSRSFGANLPDGPRAGPGQLRRSIARRDATTFWAAPFSAYALELWSTTGALQQRWLRSVDWFPPHEGSATVSLEEAPKPIIVDLTQDANGRVWVMMWVADSNWKDAVYQRGVLQGRPRYAYRTGDAYFDTLIEVFDPSSGRILVSQRVPEQLKFFVGADQAASYRETADNAVVDIWQLALTSPGERGP